MKFISIEELRAVMAEQLENYAEWKALKIISEDEFEDLKNVLTALDRRATFRAVTINTKEIA